MKILLIIKINNSQISYFKKFSYVYNEENKKNCLKKYYYLQNKDYI